MGGVPSSDSEILMARLEEMLVEAWPKRMTSTQLAEHAGIMRSTWGWCSGDFNRCYVYQSRPHIHNAKHFPPTQWRQAVDKEGNLHGWDEYDTPVTLQQVNPALNKLAKKGRVLKEAPVSGSRSCLWAAIDQEQYVLAEQEALEILRQTAIRRALPPEPEPEPEPERPRLLNFGRHIVVTREMVGLPPEPEPELEPPSTIVYC